MQELIKPRVLKAGDIIALIINEIMLEEVEETNGYWHSVESDNKWITCVKKNTEADVFKRFRNEVLL